MDEKRASRRSVLRGALFVATGTLAAGVIPLAHAQKAGKVDVKYQDAAKDGQKCADCVYFQAPDKCGVVEGAISPNGWCVMYNKKT
jgi:hypothetical protein